MPQASTRIMESTLEDLFQNLSRLAIAAIFFSTGLILAAPTSFNIPSLSAFINLDTLSRTFLAGLIVLAGIFFAFTKGHFSTAAKGLITNIQVVAVGDIFWTIGMLFIGIANSLGGFTPVGIVANLVGYGLLLVSLVLSGQLAASLS